MSTPPEKPPSAVPVGACAKRRDPARPPKSSYSWKALLHTPGRILFPPSVYETSAETQTLGNKTVGGVRSTKRVQLKDVKLQDLIDGKHLPPLTLKDFEDFLCFVELASENLYFKSFFLQYSKAYDAGSPGHRTPAEDAALADSYFLALDAFFEPASPLELNVPASLSRQLEQDVAALQQQNGEAFLAPQRFEAIYSEVSKSLEHSFRRFLLYNVRNAERNRGRFAKFVGASTVLLGVIPTIVCAVLGHSRAWRAIGIPLWWFGVVVFLGGVQRTCLVVYLFGDNRQLRPWELLRESSRCSSSSSIDPEAHVHDVPNLFKTITGNSDDNMDLEKGSGHPSPSTRVDPLAPASLNYFPGRAESVASSTDTDKKHRRTQSHSSASIFYPPSFIGPSLSTSSPTFASLTPIRDPLVRRAQWDTVVTAAAYGIFGAALMTVICLSVPNRPQ